MLGAIAGDIIGSVYESRARRIKTKEFELFGRNSRFTDDTVLTVAVADALLTGKEYSKVFREYAKQYPRAGYGGLFIRWALSIDMPAYNSFGNGSAMRVSPIGFAFDTLEAVLDEARRSAEVTHNHPEGIKGAEATAAAVFLGLNGEEREDIRTFIEDRFGYDLGRSLNEIRPGYGFDPTCQGSVPEAIISFLESNDYEDAIRNAVSLGGDSDTLAAIAGGIAHAYYKEIPGFIVERVRAILPADLLDVTDHFCRKFRVPN